MWANDSTQPLEFWWNVQGEWVEPPNHRRGGDSGVQRVTLPDQQTYYVKRQHNFNYRSLSHPIGVPTLLREWRNLRLFAKLGVPTAQAVAFESRRINGVWQAMLVTRALDGYGSLHDGMQQGLWDANTRARVLTAVLDAIAPLHRSGRKHGHLYCKEVFVRTTGEQVDVAFLDLELCRRHITPRKAAESDLRRLFRSLCDVGLSMQEFHDLLAHETKLGFKMSAAFIARCMA